MTEAHEAIKTVVEWEAVDHANKAKALVEGGDKDHSALASMGLFNLRTIGEIKKDIKNMPDAVAKRVLDAMNNNGNGKGITWHTPLGKLHMSVTGAVLAVVVLLALNGLKIISLPALGNNGEPAISTKAVVTQIIAEMARMEAEREKKEPK